MSEKAKLDKPSPQRINRYIFLVLWVLAQAAGWGLFFTLEELNVLPNFDNMIMSLIFGLTIGIPTAFLQKLVMRLHFGRTIKGWFRWSSLGWFIGGLVFGVLLESRFNIPTKVENVVYLLSFMFPVSLAQMWVLGRYINQSWIWLLSSVAGATLFSLVLEQIDNSPEMGFIAFGAYALATGLTMLWLFGMSRTVDKRKIQEAQEYERLEDVSESIDAISYTQDTIFQHRSS